MCLGPRQERRRQKAPSESEEQQKRDLKICSVDPSTNSHNHDGLSRLRRCLSVSRSNFLSFYLCSFPVAVWLALSAFSLCFFSRTFPNIQSVNRWFQCLIIFKLFSSSDFFSFFSLFGPADIDYLTQCRRQMSFMLSSHSVAGADESKGFRIFIYLSSG